jgi:hypothetical protein
MPLVRPNRRLSARLRIIARLAFAVVSACNGSTLAASGDAGAPDSAPGATSMPNDAGSAAGDSVAPDAGDGAPDDGTVTMGAATPIAWDGRAPPAHRDDAGAACPRERTRDPIVACTDAGIPRAGNPCAADSDCTAGQDGVCVCAPDPVAPASGSGPGVLYTVTACSYDECFVDSDCGPRVPCECRDTGIADSPNVCLSASNCALDSDCPPPGFCSPSPVPGESPSIGFFCHTAGDTCADDGDCQSPSPGLFVSTCRFDMTSGAWRCFQQPLRP